MKIEFVPDNVLYSIEEDTILILAIAHHHRYPHYWENRAEK